jgi:PAS domain-containing protein
MTISRSARRSFATLAGALLLAPTLLTGCSTIAYEAQERLLGLEKRDILVDRVEDAAKAQNEAKEEFADALEAFRAVVDVDGGELEATYDRLSRAFDRAEGQADDARNRVASVKRVARDLFREWEGELGDYQDAGLRRSSERQLRETQARYDELAEKMDDATASMDPVLRVFSDRVLFLKHNLNARSIAALDGETAELEADVARLIAEMEQSISAADDFIQTMRS